MARLEARARGVVGSAGILAAAALLVLGAPRQSRAEVLDSGPNGFTARTTVQIAKPAALVYDAFTGRIGDWWDASHTWSGQAANLSIDARPGGCFCERLPGGGVQHMVVLYAERGKTLRMSGGLGPLQSMAITATWSVTFAEANGSTTLEAIYAVGGYAKDGLAGLAGPVDQVIAGQLRRLKALLETQ